MTTNLNPLSLAQVFGEGAYQNDNYLVIQKSSLLRLTPQSVNSAESLLVGILITALQNFKSLAITDEAGLPIADENNQPITFDNSEAFELIKMIEWKPFQIVKNSEKYINNQIIIEGYTPDAPN